VLGDFRAMRKANRHLSGMDTLEADIGTALAEGRLAWLRHALGGDVVRKMRETLKSAAFTPFMQKMEVSAVLPFRTGLDELVLPTNRDELEFVRRRFDGEFCDLHAELGARAPEDTLVFFSCRLELSEPMKLAALLGYDGPVKMWVDGTPRFCDSKGKNPACKDSACIAFSAPAGTREVTVALGSNKGQAWGIFLRFERLDVSKRQRVKGASAIVLPRILP